MGIKNLLKFLNSYPDLIVEKNINDFKGKKIAIDISILLYQIIIYVRNTGSDLTNKKGELTSHILGLFNKTIKLLSKGIIPVYVFDGKPPQLKKKVLDIRKNIKQKAIEKMKTTTNKKDIIKYFKRSVTITKKQLDDCRQLLNLMGVQYIDAPEEADSQCAWLAKNGFVDAVFTEDMDILTFGSPYIIKNLTSINKKPIEISLQKIKNKFEWTQDEFIDFCILLGCDYCDNLLNYNCFEIFKIFQKNKSIDLFLKNTNKSIDYINSKQYFKEPNVNTNITSIKLESVNFKELVNILVNKHDLIKYKIIKKINQLIIYQAKIKCNTNVLFTFQCT